MKRRTFFQGLFSACAVFLASRFSTFPSPKTFDPSQRYGMSFPYTGHMDMELDVKDWAIEDARKALPPGTEFVVSTHHRAANDIVSWQYPVPSKYKDLPLRGICQERINNRYYIFTKRMIA